MKIAYVYDTIYPYTFGGVEKRIWQLSTRLSKKGHEVHIYGPKYWSGSSVIINDDIYLHGICGPPRSRFIAGRRSIAWPLYFAIRLLPVLLKERYDIIDCQNFPYFPCFSAKLALLGRKGCLVITWHEVWGSYWYKYLGVKGFFGKKIERVIPLLSRNIIAVSAQTKRDLESIGAKNRIEVIPNGVDFKGIQETKPTEVRSDIIYAGRMIKEKNIDVLVKAISQVKQELPDLKAVIIGNGPEEEQISNLIYELKLQKNIDMLGRLEEDAQVYAHLKSSKVFVSPSTREGFGIAAIEANACGLPAIVVKNPRNAMSDLVTENENGFICELSAQDIAKKLLLALDGDINKIMRPKCLEFSKRYDWDLIASMIEEGYKRL